MLKRISGCPLPKLINSTMNSRSIGTDMAKLPNKWILISKEYKNF